VKFFHRHKWRAAGVTLSERFYFQFGRQIGNFGEPVTDVLQLCPCGRTRTIELEGHWKLEQLQEVC
jgi:hypothetical protein